MKSKILSLEGNAVSLIVSSTNVACAYAYNTSLVDLFCSLALASCAFECSSGQDSDD